MSDHRTLTTFSSSKFEDPFVGLRFSLYGDLTGTLEHRMTIDELDVLMRQLSEERENVLAQEPFREKAMVAG